MTYYNIHSDIILSNILSGILSDILCDVYSHILCDILSGILRFLSGIPSDILFGIVFASGGSIE